MKILHILAQLPCSTGSGVYFSNLIKELEPYKHDQRAVFALQDHFTFEHLPVERQYPVRFKTEELPFPVPGMSDVMPYDSTRYCAMSAETMELWLTAFRRTLERAAADFQPDVLILHHLWILTSLALEAFPEAGSIAVCHHTDLRQAMQNPKLRECHVTRLHQLDAILSLSDVHQDEIRRIHPCAGTKIVTTGGGFDSDIFFPAENRRSGSLVKILYAGKIDDSKGVFALIRAFLALRRQDSGLELSIVGTASRENEDKLNKLINGDSGIQLHPAMSQPELAQTMREHDIFVMPSFFEGLGLIAVEALACGLRTVSTEIEGLVSLLGKKVIQSEAIEFVGLPALEYAAIPQGTQLEQFISDLAQKLSLQIARVRQGAPFPKSVYDDIARHSWAEIASRINSLIGNIKQIG